MKPYFSIIMPAYNAERYMEKAVKSIQQQKFQDWELIIIEDASQDQTLALIQEFVKQDERIRAIEHKQNKGVSEARNNGIKEAKGRYLWFVDADDYAEKTLLEEVYKSLEKNPAQYVVFGLVEEYYNQKNEFLYAHKVSHPTAYYKDKVSLRERFIYLEQKTLYGYPWNKIYEIEYLRKIGLEFEDYRVTKFIEDITFNIAYTKEIQSMNIIDKCLYHYGKRVNNNLTNQFEPQYFYFHERRIQLLLEQFQYWGNDTKEVKCILGSLYARYILSALQRNCDIRAQMKTKDRLLWCESVFETDLFATLIPDAHSRDSRALQVFIELLKRKLIRLCLVYGRLVHIIRGKLPQIYTKIKLNR